MHLMFNTYTCDANCKATYNTLDHVNDKEKMTTAGYMVNEMKALIEITLIIYLFF